MMSNWSDNLVKYFRISRSVHRVKKDFTEWSRHNKRHIIRALFTIHYII